MAPIKVRDNSNAEYAFGWSLPHLGICELHPSPSFRTQRWWFVEKQPTWGLKNRTIKLWDLIHLLQTVSYKPAVFISMSTMKFDASFICLQVKEIVWLLVSQLTSGSHHIQRCLPRPHHTVPLSQLWAHIHRIRHSRIKPVQQTWTQAELKVWYKIFT